MQDDPEMEAKNGGHLDLDIPADSFLTVFEPNDYVKLTMDGYGTVIVPVLASMDNALAGLTHSNEHGRLLQVEFRRRCAEIYLCCRLDTHRIIEKIKLV